MSLRHNLAEVVRKLRLPLVALLAVVAAMAPGAAAQKVSFHQAIEMSLTRSAGMGMALADQIKARQGYLEARAAYYPQVTFGSGIAQTWGYPMSIEGSAPSVFNINSQSFLLNFAQARFVQAARSETNAAGYVLKSQRSATILETALTYIQLTRTEDKLRWLEKEAQDAERAETISRDRLKEGLDSKIDVTRAQLTGAKVRLRIAEAQGSADVLRQRLSQLTGMDARELATDSATIPPEPETSQQDDYVERALQHSPQVQAAEQRARAREQRARGEHNQLYPAIDLVGNYGLFTKYNNLSLLFPNGQFSRNNATFGLAIRFAFFNGPQRAKAAGALADSMRAEKELQATRDVVASDTLKLQRSLRQLAAARDVARLEFDLAVANVEAVPLRIQTGEATLKDEQIFRVETGDKQAALIDAQIELDRVRLQLLRQTDDLERWALP